MSKKTSSVSKWVRISVTAKKSDWNKVLKQLNQYFILLDEATFVVTDFIDFDFINSVFHINVLIKFKKFTSYYFRQKWLKTHCKTILSQVNQKFTFQPALSFSIETKINKDFQLIEDKINITLKKSLTKVIIANIDNLTDCVENVLTFALYVNQIWVFTKSKVLNEAIHLTLVNGYGATFRTDDFNENNENCDLFEDVYLEHKFSLLHIEHKAKKVFEAKDDLPFSMLNYWRSECESYLQNDNSNVYLNPALMEISYYYVPIYLNGQINTSSIFQRLIFYLLNRINIVFNKSS